MENIFAGKNIVLGVTGSIAAFKVAGWASTLAKEDANVRVIMTDAASKFVTPLTFAALTGNKPYGDMFEDVLDDSMAHIDIAQDADIFIIAPASAQTIARLAQGLADNLLGAAVLATRAPVVIFPAMNSKMYLHEATQKNIQIVKEYGYTVIDPDSGMMACKDEGVGRLVEWEHAEDRIKQILSVNDFEGKRILVTAGPTRETIDPARFISNRSSGKMGYAIARAAFHRGAEVVLVSGPTSLNTPSGVRCIHVTSANEMYDAVMQEYDDVDIIIKSAAVSDFAPANVEQHKIKKDKIDSSIELIQNPDILNELGEKNVNKEKILIGFAAESQNIIDEGRKKLHKKNLDIIAVNDISTDNTGFEVDTNRVTLIDSTTEKELPHTSKYQTAHLLLDGILEKMAI